MEKTSEGTSQYSTKYLRQRKFLMVLPVLVLPFAVLFLSTLGLVGTAKAEGNSAKKVQGLNLTLPNAAPAKDSNWTKLKYYQQADKDSAKLKALLKNDPFRKMELETNERERWLKSGRSFGRFDSSYLSENGQDQNEERVHKKLAALNRELGTAAVRQTPSHHRSDPKMEASLPSSDVQRLEKMMQTVQQNKGEDEEMKQYNELLEKILDIQNPERVQQRLQKQSEQNKRLVLPVEKPTENVVTILEAKKDFRQLLTQYQPDSVPEAMQVFMKSNRFYSIDEPSIEAGGQPCIPAVVHENQTVASGESIKLRLLEDIYVAGILIPKDHFIHGGVTLNGERLQVTISTIEFQNHILPVSLSVYDKKDGLPGIKIPGAITRDVAKKSAVQSMQGLSTINSLDPSIGAQAVTAGIQAAQNLVSKRAKLVKATVEAGYFVLLKDDNSKGK